MELDEQEAYIKGREHERNLIAQKLDDAASIHTQMIGPNIIARIYGRLAAKIRQGTL